MKNKWIAILLAAAVGFAALVGCTGDNGTEDPPGSSSAAIGRPSSTKLLRKAAWIITPRRSGAFSASSTTPKATTAIPSAMPTTNST